MSIQALYVKEGAQPIWKGEAIAFSLDMSPWLTSPTVSQFKLYDPTEVDVTAGQTSGSSSVSGNNVITPKCVPSSVGRYRWVMTVTSGGLTYIAICDLDSADPLDFV